MTTIRQKRYAELLFEELSSLITLEASDPRLATITITAVEVSPDLRSAKVFYLDDSERTVPEVLAGLEHAQSFLRRELALRLMLRYVPELHFHEDVIEKKARRIDALLQKIHEEEEQETNHENPGTKNPAG